MEKLDRKIIRKMIIQEVGLIKVRNKKIRKRNLSILKSCVIKENKMLDAGYSQSQIKNIILNEFSIGGMDAIGDTLKQTSISFIANSMGIDIDSFLGAVIVNTIENISYEEFTAFISGEGNRCELVLDNLASGMIEAIGEQIMESFTGTGQSETGMISATFQEMINNMLSENKYSEMLKNSLRDIICNMSFENLFSFGSGKDASSSMVNPMKALETIGSFMDFSE